MLKALNEPFALNDRRNGCGRFLRVRDSRRKDITMRHQIKRSERFTFRRETTSACLDAIRTNKAVTIDYVTWSC